MGNFCGSKELAYQTHQEPIYPSYTRKSTKISIFTQSYQDIQDYNDENLLCTPFPNFCKGNGDSIQEDGRSSVRGCSNKLDDNELKTSDDEYFNLKNYRTGGTFKKPELRLSLKSSTFRPISGVKSPEKGEKKIRLGYHQYLNSNKIQETEQSVALNTIYMNDKYSSMSDSSSDEDQLRYIDIRNPRRGSRNQPQQDPQIPQQFSKTTKYQFTPAIRFLELGEEEQNKSLNKTIYSPVNKTVVNNNWNDDSSLNPVQTSGLLDEITPFQSFIKGSHLLQKTSEQKQNKNIKNKISLNKAPRLIMDSDDEKQDEGQYNNQDIFKGQDTQMDIDLLNDMITPRFELHDNNSRNVCLNNKSNLFENSVLSKISNDSTFDQIRLKNYKEFIKEYQFEDKNQFKELLKNNILPLIYREIKQGDDHKVIFEGSFWVQKRANGAYVNRWCQLSNNYVLFFEDEYSSKSFQPPLAKIQLSEKVNIQKSKDFYYVRDQDKYEFKLIIGKKNQSNTEFLNQKLLKEGAQTKSDLSIGDVSAINLREQDRSSNNNNQTLSFIEDHEIFSPTEKLYQKHITFQSHNFNQSAKFILITKLLLKIIKD